MKEVFTHTEKFERGSFKDLITKMIFLAQALGFEPRRWVTGKELELLIELTSQYYEGIDLGSRESIVHALANTSFEETDKNIYVYRASLIKKGWIQKKGKHLDLLPFLKVLIPDPSKTELTISIKSL